MEPQPLEDDDLAGGRPQRLVPEPPPGGWLSDEPPMETYQHLMQMLALIATLRFLWRERTDYFAGGNLTVYFSPVQKKSDDFRGPDFFVVLGVDGTKPRASWVVWEEGGRYPNFIVEIASDSTARVDRGEKKRIYQDIFRTPEYFVFDPETAVLEGWRLVGGRYQAMAPDSSGCLTSEQLELKLGIVDRELRFFSPDGVLVSKPEEAALEAQRRADEEQRRADEEQRRADAERQRADEAQLRAEAAERELAALKSRREG
ncbi:MAG TPA: Uma2 family endonuclease [Polyangiaceae bacterium]